MPLHTLGTVDEKKNLIKPFTWNKLMQYFTNFQNEPLNFRNQMDSNYNLWYFTTTCMNFDPDLLFFFSMIAVILFTFCLSGAFHSKTNAKSTRWRIQHNVSWHHPIQSVIFFLLLLVSITEKKKFYCPKWRCNGSRGENGTGLSDPNLVHIWSRSES